AWHEGPNGELSFVNMLWEYNAGQVPPRGALISSQRLGWPRRTGILPSLTSMLSSVAFYGPEKWSIIYRPAGAPAILGQKPESITNLRKMLPQRMNKAITENPKKLANLIDLVNLPSTLREFVGQSRTSRLGCFMRVWSYIKENNLQDPNNKTVVNCDEKLKTVLLGKPQIELAELPMLVKLHFSKVSK
ncbi:hypothetical protein RJ639_038116, partial [Escallonia herrerae]